MALQVGDRVPEFSVITGPGETATSGELFAMGPTVIHFYIFDFTGSMEGG
jgi:peroxiredoxin